MDNKETKSKKPRKKAETKEEVVMEKSEVKVDQQPQIDMNQMFQMFTQFMQQQQAIVNKVETKEVAKPKRLTKSYLRRERGTEDVLVRSIIDRVSFRSPKTQIEYNWISSGDEDWVSINEILQMETLCKGYFHAPWLIIEDDEVNKVLGLKYDELTELDERIVDMDFSEIRELVDGATKDFKETVTNIIMEKIRNKEIRDNVLIDELTKLLGVDFNMFE